MPEKSRAEPDSTAVRVALWRALHLEIDAPPRVFEDEIGLRLAAPDERWRSRPDISSSTRPLRASILARAGSQRTAPLRPVIGPDRTPVNCCRKTRGQSGSLFLLL